MVKKDKPFREFYPEALKASPLFSRLKQANYRMGLYEDSLIIDQDQISDFENIIPISGGSSFPDRICKDDADHCTV